MKCKCGNDIHVARANLGFSVCLDCGQAKAKIEIEGKANRIAVAYSKGPLMYMGAPDVAQQNLKDTMGAQGRSVANLNPFEMLATDIEYSQGIARGTFQMTTITGRLPRPPERQEFPRAIGTMWLEGEPVAIFDRNDPRIQKASRHVFFTPEAIQGNARHALLHRRHPGSQSSKR